LHARGREREQEVVNPMGLVLIGLGLAVVCLGVVVVWGAVAQDVVQICREDAAACAQLERCLAIATGVIPVSAGVLDPPVGSYDEQQAERREKCQPFERFMPEPATLTAIGTVTSNLDDIIATDVE
jgi:hypothetical protein